MTDLSTFIVIELALVGIASTASTLLVAYLYIFSSALRPVITSANSNFKAWRLGDWSVRTGQPTHPSIPQAKISATEYEAPE